MGKDYCSVFKCHNYSGRVGKFGTKVTLHKIPKEQYARRAWIRAISRKNWMPTSYTRVCSDHFVDGIGPNSLNRNKIPTVNLPQKRADSRKLSRKSPRKRFGFTPPSEGVLKSDNKFKYDTDCHSYAQVQQPKSTADCMVTASSSSSRTAVQATQTCQAPVTDVGTEVLMPELVIENISHSNDLIMFYTGLPDKRTFNALFESLMEQLINFPQKLLVK